MKIATSELKGKLLDWAVAKCEGEETHMHHGKLNTRWSNPSYSPTTDWAQGGPIIEREGINTYQMQDGTWQGNLDYGMTDELIYWGPTPLIAAMRCYVASKLGDEVEIPEELA